MSIFSNSKYTKAYFTLLEKHKQPRKKINGVYTEKHHVIPKSLGGDNSPENIVRLSARAHYLAHILLTKAVLPRYRIRMIVAVQAMTMNAVKRGIVQKVNSFIFQRLREEHSKWLSNSKWYNDGVHTYRLLEKDSGNLDKGRLKLPSRSGVMFITDGVNTKRLKISEKIPDGWWQGASEMNRAAWAASGEGSRTRGTATGKIWVNNGSSNKLVKKIENGWVPGRLAIGAFDPKRIRSSRAPAPVASDAQSLAE